MSALSGSREPSQSPLSRPVGFDPERVRDAAAIAYLMADAGADANWAMGFLAETRNLEHYGDCTRVAMTCDRCCAEEALKAADQALAAQGMARDSAETEGLRPLRAAKPGPKDAPTPCDPSPNSSQDRV